MSWKKKTRFGYETGEIPSPEEFWPALKDPKAAVAKAREYIEEYKKGPWPSVVKEMAEKSKYPVLIWALGLVVGRSPWDTGAAPVPGVFSGILGRVMHITIEKICREGAPEEYKKWEEMGLVYAGKVYEVHERVLSSPAGFWKTPLLRVMCELVDRFGWSLMQFRGGTGASPIIHTDMSRAEKFMMACRLMMPTDVGGVGDVQRMWTCCPGPATCPFACYDTIQWWEECGKKWPEWQTYPQFPYKIKFKFSGCPIDCIKAIVGTDYAVIGKWLGAPQIDQEEFRRMVKSGEVDAKEVVESCPTGALSWDASTLELKCDPRKCVQCMNCIIRANPAILPGKEKGVMILLGGTIKSFLGPKMCYTLIPFIKVTPENEMKVIRWFLDLIEKIVYKWADAAKTRERVGDLSVRFTWSKFLREVAELPYPDLVTKEPAPGEVPYHEECISYAMIPKDQKWAYWEVLKKTVEKW